MQLTVEEKWGNQLCRKLFGELSKAEHPPPWGLAMCVVGSGSRRVFVEEGFRTQMPGPRVHAVGNLTLLPELWMLLSQLTFLSLK